MVNRSINVLDKLCEIVFNAPSSSKLKSNLVCVSAPGRINIIGEHTDYNGGLILPGAINKRTYCAGALSNDEYIYLYSENEQRKARFKIKDIVKESNGVEWFDYVKGVVKEFIERGYYYIKPFMLGIYSDVPIGAGVSSSASFEVAVASFISEMFELSISDEELISISWSAERNFVGSKCGIMDQLSSVMGKENCVIKVDCKDVPDMEKVLSSIDYIPFPSDKVSIILIDSLVKHSVAGSGYQTRVEECKILLEEAKKIYPELLSLRDITVEILEDLKSKVQPNIFNRGKHFIEENERVDKSASALMEGDIETLGELLFESHESLSSLYEVSTESLDRLVELAKRQNHICYGSRLLGAGFGGATINLIKAGEEEKFIRNVADKYYSELNTDDRNIIICNISDGAKTEKVNE